MCDLEGVKLIYNTVSKYHKKFALLHCVSAYPTPDKDANLNVIGLFHEIFPDIIIGYSGHELGFNATIGAVALGSKVKKIICKQVLIFKIIIVDH